MTATAIALKDETGERCATVEFKRIGTAPKLDDLWFFTGSVCNLKCIHCYTGSSPQNSTYEFLTVTDVGPVLEEARRFNVREIYFTGGEPFANPSFLDLLAAALEVAPTTTLTNGTELLARALPKLVSLRKQYGEKLAFRVSLDHYEEARHNAIRRSGNGRKENNYAKTVDSVVQLAKLGFTPIITYTAEVFRGNPVPVAYVERRTVELFAARGAQVEVKFLSAIIDQGSQRLRRDTPKEAPFLSDRYLEAINFEKESLMCHNSRMVTKRNDALHIYPCPVLVGSDEASFRELAPFDLGSTLEESFTALVPDRKSVV